MKRRLPALWVFRTFTLFVIAFVSSPFSGFTQSGNVVGIIKDVDGRPIENATVTVKETKATAVSDSTGRYIVSAKKGHTLFVTHVNFSPQSVVIGEVGNTNITLLAKPANLDEVVVIGYGTQRNRTLTGAVSVVGQSLIKDRPLTSASVALEGTVPGVQINQNSGQAGRNDVIIRIRGVGTLNNAAPLILVDGIEAPFDNINPNDIATITVLKDAASAAIYGSRAANGVVLVTTKRGRSRNGLVNVSYNGFYGVTEATRLPKMVTNSLLFATLRNEANANFGNPAVYNDAALTYFRTRGPNTDWFKEIFDKGSLHQHNFNFDGGNDITSYRLSFGYQDEKGISLRSNAQRYNGRFNLDIRPTNKWLFSTNLSLVRRKRSGAQDDETSGDQGAKGLVYRAAESIPTIPAYDSLGRLAGSNGAISGPNLGNPLTAIYGNEFGEKTLEALASAMAEFRPVKGLVLSGTYAVNYRTVNQQNFSPSFSTFDFITGEEVKYNALRGRSRSYFEGTNTTLILQGTYERRFGGHNFKFLAGFNQEDANSNIFGAYRNGFLTNTVRVLSVGLPASATNFESGTTWGLRSYFGRLNYNWQEKYLFEANVRGDGTSRFQNKKWGVFPSFSAGWVASEEKFFTGISQTIDYLKVRGSWGQLGNQIADPNDDFIYARQLSLSQNYNFGGTIVPGVAQVTLGNPDLTWETTTSSNIGLDLRLWKSKLSFTADYFVRNTKDILFAVPVSPLTGFNTQIENSARVQNKGWELSSAYTGRIGSLNFSVGGNVTHVTSMIKQLNKELKDGDVDRYVYSFEGRRVAQRGSPLNSLYGVQMIGIFQSADEVAKAPDQKGLDANFGPGDPIFFDTNGDGKINNEDRTVIGKEDPTWVYGFNLDMRFNGFDLAALFNGAADFNSYAGEEIARPFFGNASLEQRWLNRWTPQNTNTNIPRLFFTSGPATSINNSFWVFDRSYLRFKNLQIGYSFPTRVTQKLKINRLRIFANGSNLFTITKFPYFDPERPSGKDRGQEGYPNLRVISAGFDIGF